MTKNAPLENVPKHLGRAPPPSCEQNPKECIFLSGNRPSFSLILFFCKYQPCSLSRPIFMLQSLQKKFFILINFQDLLQNERKHQIDINNERRRSSVGFTSLQVVEFHTWCISKHFSFSCFCFCWPCFSPHSYCVLFLFFFSSCHNISLVLLFLSRQGIRLYLVLALQIRSK